MLTYLELNVEMIMAQVYRDEGAKARMHYLQMLLRIPNTYIFVNWPRKFSFVSLTGERNNLREMKACISPNSKL